MAHDYEDIFNLDDLTDVELRDLVRGKSTSTRRS